MIHYPYPIAVISPFLQNLVAGTWFHQVLAEFGIPVRPWVDFHVVGLWLIYMSLFFSIFSATQYFLRFVKAINKKDQETGVTAG